MSTTEPAAPDFSTLAGEIARVANEVFSGRAATPPGTQVPAVVAPPAVGPSALNVGGGGLSTQTTLPPIPGPFQAPPPVATPLPREADFRPLPTQLAEQLGTPTPIAIASTAPASEASPYFLQIAGLPNVQAPSSAPLPSNALVPPNAPVPSTAQILSSQPTASPSNATLPSSAPLPSNVQAVPNSAPPASSTQVVPSHAPLISSYDFSPELVPELGQKTREPFDPQAIKRDFPILSERVHGRELVWLDNAATTQKPRTVIERVSAFYEHENSNIHRAAHTLAARATDAYEAARETTRRFLNAPSVREIVFVRGATEAINLVAQSWGRRNVSAGDEIVVSWLEHHANIVPWQQLAAEKGAKLRVAPVDDRGQIILEEYDRLLNPRTRLVAFTQVSNALGTVTPAREMIEMAHRRGARVLLDGAQSVSHMRVDVQALDCDFFCFSGHKVFAPTGIGALFGKSDVLADMPPWQGGGNMIQDVTFERTVYQPAPQRFEAGTGNIADAVGLGAALEYLSGIGLENVARYEHELLEYANAALCDVPGLRLIGTAPDKAGVLSFVLDGQRTEEVGELLDREGIAVRSGHHCAQPILRRFGLENSVRASLALYNTKQDIDRLVAALKRLQLARASA